jgi:hypothetical protein
MPDVIVSPAIRRDGTNRSVEVTAAGGPARKAITRGA